MESKIKNEEIKSNPPQPVSTKRLAVSLLIRIAVIAAGTRRLLEIYSRLLAGTLAGTELWREVKAISRLGVTRGTLKNGGFENCRIKNEPLK